LTLGVTIPADEIAESVCVAASEVIVSNHPPTLATVGYTDFSIHHGVQMGRPSLETTAYRIPTGIRAEVGGSCVPVLKGEAAL